jgi:hypothetical protein
LSEYNIYSEIVVGKMACIWVVYLTLTTSGFRGLNHGFVDFLVTNCDHCTSSTIGHGVPEWLQKSQIISMEGTVLLPSQIN